MKNIGKLLIWSLKYGLVAGLDLKYELSIQNPKDLHAQSRISKFNEIKMPSN